MFIANHLHEFRIHKSNDGTDYYGRKLKTLIIVAKNGQFSIASLRSIEGYMLDSRRMT